MARDDRGNSVARRKAAPVSGLRIACPCVARERCQRCDCFAKTADIVDRMLRADARAHHLWHAVSEHLKDGDIKGAADALAAVALDTAEAQHLGEIAAIAVFELLTLERTDQSRSN